MSKLRNLVESGAGSALARQLALADFLGSHEWNVNTQTGRADFGKKQEHRIQFVGTESEHTGTWMWAWANTASGLPEELCEASQAIRRHGVQHGIKELSEGQLPLQDLNGHLLCMAGAALSGGHPYYRGPYDGGALYFYVLDLPDVIQAQVDVPRAVTVIQQLISGFDLNPWRTIALFLEGEGLGVQAENNIMVATWPGGDELRIEFDEQGRVVRIHAEASQRPEAKRPRWKFW